MDKKNIRSSPQNKPSSRHPPADAQTGHAELPAEHFKELHRLAAAGLEMKVQDLVLNGPRDALNFEYPDRRLKAQTLYDQAAAKVETDLVAEHATKFMLEEKVRKEEAKTIKDFNECKMLPLEK